ncbi:MAG: AAA domain-containing protein [Bacteroidota bacterium]
MKFLTKVDYICLSLASFLLFNSARLTHEEIDSEIRHQIALLKKEKAKDYELFQARMMNTSLKEREKNGVSWYPILLLRDFISTGERVTIEIEKQKNHQQKHSFQVGAVVGVFSGENEKTKTANGVVSYLNGSRMRIVMNQSNIPDWMKSDKIGLNLLFDDGTYKEMNKALNTLLKAKNDRLSFLREVFYGLRQSSTRNIDSFEIPSLNEGQNRAYTLIAASNDVAFVHGPPGTGKTTTLTKCIKETVRLEKQVLVCAPSNAAVDLLVEKLSEEGLNVLRMGHPARLTPYVVENSLDVKISKHADFGRLKEMRRQSEEYRSLATKYKRKFGNQEKRQRDMLFKEAKALRNDSRELEQYIAENLSDQAEVIACTLAGASHSLLRDRLFKTVFIDESSQAIEAATWIPLDRTQRVIMSGDHFQLPPTIKSIEAAREGLETTLFAKGLANQPLSCVMLETQYRMEPEIMNFSSRKFYKGKLKAAETITHRLKLFETPVRFIDTAGAGFNEKLKEETLSTYNEEGAAMLLKIMSEDPLDNLSIGVIAPYKAQVEVLRSSLNQSKKLAQFRENIDVNSVDAFQGQERDVIYISLTRSNSRGEIGFLKEYRRLNVAMTRARHMLVIVGDSSTLGTDSFFSELLDYVEKNGRYTSVFEHLTYHE